MNANDLEDIRKTEINGYCIETEDCFGGEGLGEEYWFVLRITETKSKKTKFIKFNAWYDSWNGCEWHKGFEIVNPVEVIKVEWRKTKY